MRCAHAHHAQTSVTRDPRLVVRPKRRILRKLRMTRYRTTGKKSRLLQLLDVLFDAPERLIDNVLNFGQG
jgi:hypothetical protein